MTAVHSSSINYHMWYIFLTKTGHVYTFVWNPLLFLLPFSEYCILYIFLIIFWDSQPPSKSCSCPTEWDHFPSLMFDKVFCLFSTFHSFNNFVLNFVLNFFFFFFLPANKLFLFDKLYVGLFILGILPYI